MDQRKLRVVKHQPQVETYSVAHCGCGFRAETVDQPRFILSQLMAHCEETGHCGHFQGEIRPAISGVR